MYQRTNFHWNMTIHAGSKSFLQQLLQVLPLLSIDRAQNPIRNDRPLSGSFLFGDENRQLHRISCF